MVFVENICIIVGSSAAQQEGTRRRVGRDICASTQCTSLVGVMIVAVQVAMASWRWKNSDVPLACIRDIRRLN